MGPCFMRSVDLRQPANQIFFQQQGYSGTTKNCNLGLIGEQPTSLENKGDDCCFIEERGSAEGML